MARETAYRVPRRFITAPQEPPPYGLLALSFTGHLVLFLGAMVLSTFLSTRLDQSKIYIVNLVPAEAPLGSPAPRPAGPPVPARLAPVPRTPATPAPPTPRVEERTPPKPPKVETASPKAESPVPPAPRIETPPPKIEAPPLKADPPPPPPALRAKAEAPPPLRPEKPVEPVAPPRVPELAPRAAAVRSPELALPRRVEKETPALDNPAARARLVERPLSPPTPPAMPLPARVPEPPRVTSPQAAPAPTTTVASVRSADPVRLGRPDSMSAAAPNISLDVNDFPFTYYLRQLKAKVEERFVPPRPAAVGGERAIILFEIGRDGQILREPAVERSSGSTLYDQAALRAVTEAKPFPPLPPEFKAPSLRVHFGFDFQPDQG